MFPKHVLGILLLALGIVTLAIMQAISVGQPIEQAPRLETYRSLTEPIPPAPLTNPENTKTARPRQITEKKQEDTILCNSKNWLPCSPGQEFYCPPSGDAQCKAGDLPSPTEQVQARAITAKSIVALRCHYKTNNTVIKDAYGDENGDIIFSGGGSGVIINPGGYILTAKHIVDPKWSNFAFASTTSERNKNLYENIEFNYCDVGIPPRDDLPTQEQIKEINPMILVDSFPYTATLYFKPPKSNLSDLEYRKQDFAVLKITGLVKGCEIFGPCKLLSSYPYNPVLYQEIPGRPGQINELINFGYPAEASPAFKGLYLLKGAVGPLVEYYGGDGYFKNGYFLIAWTANDLIPGRSGSPVFWKGYVVGIEFSGGEGQPLNYAVGMPAIHQILKDNGLEGILKTN